MSGKLTRHLAYHLKAKFMSSTRVVAVAALEMSGKFMCTSVSDWTVAHLKKEMYLARAYHCKVCPCPAAACVFPFCECTMSHLLRKYMFA